MRKTIYILLFSLILVCSLAACGSGKSAVPSASATPAAAASGKNHLGENPQIDEKGPMTRVAELLNGKILVEVVRTRPEAKMKEMYDQGYAEYLPGFQLKGYIYADSLTDGLLLLRSGRADVLQVMDFSADYLVKRNGNLVSYPNPGWDSITQMLFRSDLKSSYDKVNASIKEMKQDGTLDKLVEKWITQLPAGQEPSGGTLPAIVGAATINVGISGDEPPLDYIAANGKPGGFNIAALSEISQRAGININLVTVTGGARFAALASGKIDAFLWNNSSKSLNGMMRTSSGTVNIGDTTLLATDDYLDAASALVTVKK